MSDDILERLRTFDIYDYADADKICREAAARIGSQAARIAELEAILGQLLDAQSPTLEVVKRIGRAALAGGKDDIK